MSHKVKVKQLGGLPFFREITLDTLTLSELQKKIAFKFKCEVGMITKIQCVAGSTPIQGDADVQKHCQTIVELTFLKNIPKQIVKEVVEPKTEVPKQLPQIPSCQPIVSKEEMKGGTNEALHETPVEAL